MAYLTDIFRRLTRGMAAQILGDHTDQQLVHMALSGRDEAAFQAIVYRHGPMVFRVCWRVLQHSQNAEDAFQATFLVLAQKLLTLRKHASLASWLHRVAYRLALKTKTRSAAQRSHEQQAARPESLPPDEVAWGELRQALDFELGQLPDKWRLPLILCYLEGRTQDESASQLGWAKNTLKRRLEEARTALGFRLSRRGLAVPAALSAILLSDCSASASPMPAVFASTVEVAWKVVLGQPLAACGLSAGVAALAKGGCVMMSKGVLFVLLSSFAIGTIAIGSGYWAENGQGQQPNLAASAIDSLHEIQQEQVQEPMDRLVVSKARDKHEDPPADLPKATDRLNPDSQLPPRKPKPATKPPQLFVGWPKPELALVVSGQQHGYWQRCGCSDPQLGGLTRRYNFMQTLRDKGWPLVAVDIGEIAQASGPQSILKYEYSMRSLKLMKYDVVGLGKTEFNMPLGLALGRFALNNPFPSVIATNLMDPERNFEQAGLRKFKIVDVRPRLGFFSVVDSKMAKEITDPQSKFISAASELASVLQMRKAEVNILIYQGTDDKSEIAKFLAEFSAIRAQNKQIPDVAIVLCLSADPEPSERAKVIGSTTVISLGHKGRYVGVLGLFRNPRNKGYSLKYQLVPVGEEYDTPDDPALIAQHEIMQLWEDYAKIVEKDRYIERFPRGPHPLQVELKRLGLETHYVGSKICAACHPGAFSVWERTAHAHAFTTLEKVRNPSRRQFDGECVQCHTVGFQQNTGYLAPGNTPALNELLKNVGCESCHGPASAHLQNPRDMKIHQLMNPYSTTHRIPPQNNNKALVEAHTAQQLNRQDAFCQRCHDTENDVHYGKTRYQEYWNKIKH